MSASQVVGLVFAIFAVVGVCFLALVLVRVTELLLTIKGTLTTITAAALPLLEEAERAAMTGNEGMVKVAAIADNIQVVTDNVSAVSATAGAAAGSPIIKTAKFSYGVRRIITSRRSPDRAKQVRTELAAERRGLKRGARAGAGAGTGGGAGAGTGGGAGAGTGGGAGSVTEGRAANRSGAEKHSKHDH